MCKAFHCAIKGLNIYYVYYFEILNLREPLWGSKGRWFYSHLRRVRLRGVVRFFPISHSMLQRQNIDPRFQCRSITLVTTTHWIWGRQRKGIIHKNQLFEALENEWDLSYLTSFGNETLFLSTGTFSVNWSRITYAMPSFTHPLALTLISTAFNVKASKVLHSMEQLFRKAIWQWFCLRNN